MIAQPKKLMACALLLCGGALVLWGAYMPAKAKLAQFLLERSWQVAQQSGRPQPPWPRAAAESVASLTFTTGERFIVLDQAHGKALAFAPGLVAGSDHPDRVAQAGGSHVIIAAHRDTQFQSLGSLAPGALVRVETPLGAELTYRVEGQVIANKDSAHFVQDSADRLSLVTCWPLNGLRPNGPERLIISARRVNLPKMASSWP